MTWTPPPLRLPGSRLRWTAFVVVWLGLTAAAAFEDAALLEWVRHDGRSLWRDVLTFPDYLGGYSIHLLTLGIVVAVAEGRRRRTAAEYIGVMLFQAAVCDLVKVAVGRARPHAELGPWAFHPPGLPIRHAESFPSGDASAAMALATLLGHYFPAGRRYFWALGMWGALGRFAVGRHYLSDVVFGAGLGVLSAWAALEFLQRYWAKRDRRRGARA